jgi:hypothetical protein
MPDTFVPVDHAILGIVDAVTELPGADSASTPRRTAKGSRA